MQGYAKQRSYIFVYTWPPINGCGLSVLRDVVVNAREFSVPYESRLTVMLRTSRAIERWRIAPNDPRFVGRNLRHVFISVTYDACIASH